MIGHWTFYYTNGIKEKKGLLSMGMPMVYGFFTMTILKKLKKGLFQMEQKEGQWTAWFEDGRLSEGYYANGKKDATWTSWWDHERTKKEMQGNYKNGQMVDKWFFYDKNGNLKEIRYFSPDF